MHSQVNLRLCDRICRGCHQVLRISLFQRKNAGHDLRCTCHRAHYMLFFSEQNPAAVRIHQRSGTGIEPGKKLLPFLLTGSFFLCSLRIRDGFLLLRSFHYLCPFIFFRRHFPG